MKTLMTVCYVLEPSRILLGLKKRRLGKGFWNGFGGRVEEGETIEEAAIREVEEEAGITVEDIAEIGVLEFESAARPNEVLEVHFFTATRYSGAIQESNEMKPRWFRLDEIPYENMWESDAYWFPLMLAQKRFKGKFSFDRNDVITAYSIEKELFL